MSTRSTINIKNEDGTIDSIYCHYDGYPDNNGRMLLRNYDTVEKARQLVDLGNLRFLGPSIEETEDYATIDNIPKDISSFTDLADFDKGEEYQEYNYLWMDDMWWLNDSIGHTWLPLDQIII